MAEHDHVQSWSLRPAILIFLLTTLVYLDTFLDIHISQLWMSPRFLETGRVSITTALHTPGAIDRASDLVIWSI